MHNPRILFAAGGTGGHVYPAIAIADAVKGLNPEAAVLFVGTKDKMEWAAVPKAGYPIKGIWISGFRRKFDLRNLIFPLKLVVSIIQSIRIVGGFKPQVVVSCGGYASGPAGWVASKMNVSLVIQEQNSFPGVTSRMLAKYAKKIFTAFDDAAAYFPGRTVENVGNPTRNTLTASDKESGLNTFDFDGTKPVLLILGGSLGAKSINEAMKLNLHNFAGLQIIWQCGNQYYDELAAEINPDSEPLLRLMPYLENMAEAYAAADLVISRAGASSCSEIMLTGKPAILVPSPNVAGDHQTKNAQSMADAGAAVLLKDADANSRLSQLVHSLIHDPKRLGEMSKAALKLAKPDAAHTIAREILDIANLHLN